jgi:hypothetical protein
MGESKTKAGDNGCADILIVVGKTKYQSIMDVQDACFVG